MALQLPHSTPFGVTAEYHRLLTVKYDFAAACATFVIAVYPTPEARTQGYGVLWHEYVTVPLTAMPGDPRPGLYDFLSSFPGSYLAGAARDPLPDPTPLPVAPPPAPPLPLDDTPVADAS